MNEFSLSKLAYLDECIRRQEEEMGKLIQYEQMIRTRHQEELDAVAQELQLSSSSESHGYSERIRDYEDYMQKQFGAHESHPTDQDQYQEDHSYGEKEAIHSFIRKPKAFHGETQDTVYVVLPKKNKYAAESKLQEQLQVIRERARQQAIKQYYGSKATSAKQIFSKCDSMVQSNMGDLSIRYLDRLHSTCEPYTIRNIIARQKGQILQAKNRKEELRELLGLVTR